MSIEDRLITTELKKQEAIIDRCQKAFLEAGQALLTIRDAKLYKVDYDTFDDYCKQRWSMKRSRAYQLIEAVQVQATIADSIDESEQPRNESQFRVLAAVPEEKRAEVVTKANDTAWADSRHATADDYKQAAKKVTAEIEYEDIDPELTNRQIAQQAIANAAIGEDIVRKLDQAKSAIKAVKEVPGTELLVARESSIIRDLDNVRQAVAVTIPHKICDNCSGDGCVQCGNFGWVNRISQ